MSFSDQTGGANAPAMPASRKISPGVGNARKVELDRENMVAYVMDAEPQRIMR